MAAKKTALVLGANGIIGRNLTRHLEATNKWQVLASSRSALDYETSAQFVQMDLLKPESFLAHKEVLATVTDVFFSAYIEKDTLAEQTKANLKLLTNLVEELESLCPALRHISFIQGGKAYGAHLGRYKTPAKETDPRHFPPNFYYAQEDYLREKSAGKKWSWTALRPDIIIGTAVRNPMNLANVIAVYAVLCREFNVPFRFPGSLAAYNALVNVTGADVLAKGLEWSSLNEKCNGQIFNITNGDVFRWSEVWPKIAEYFQVETAEPLTFSLAEYMADKSEIWDQLIVKYKLVKTPFKDLVQWPFGDFIFNVENDAFFDVNKARRFGFQEMNLDSADHMISVFKTLQELRWIP